MKQVDLPGYVFHEKDNPNSPGCSELEVMLRQHPTGLHFDPERIILNVASPAGEMQHSTITNTAAAGPAPVRICAGRIVLADRLDKHVQFLTLGGTMTLTHEDEGTLCRIHSSAPIIALSLSREPAELLAEEIEALLAKRRAAWKTHPREFEQRLARIEPAALYLACLAAIAHTLDGLNGHTSDDARRLAHFVDVELEQVNSKGAQAAASLEDVL